MSLLKKASIITTPTAYAEDYLYSIKPALKVSDTEIITNGDFSNGLTNWTGTNPPTLNADNSLTFDDVAENIFQSIAFTVGRRYRLVFDGTGNIRYRTGFAGSDATQVAISLPFETNIVATSNTNRIQPYGPTSGTGTLKSISLKEVTDADFDFDRNSTGTRVNEDYLIEDVPYNLLQQSQTFGTYWSNTNSSESLDTSVLAPDGTATAWKLQANAGTHFSFITQTLTMSGQISFSVFIKKGTATTASMFLTEGGNLGLTANLENGTITSVTGSNMVGTVESAGNGWYRFEIKHTSGDDLTNSVRIGVEGGSFGSVTYAGTENIYIWGAQITKGDKKPYLKTTDRLDIPRIDYTNGEPSILLEPQRQNLIPNSTTTIANNTTIEYNNILSPENILNGVKVTSTALSAYVRTDTVAMTSNNTISVFLKAGTSNYAQVLGAGNAGDFFNINLDNFTIGNTGATTSNVTIQQYSNNWYRCSAKFAGYTGNTTIRLLLSDSDSNFNATSSTTGKFLYYYGLQLETGSYATSLIHTSGSAVTRSADAANNAGNSDLINSTEGVLYAEISSFDISGDYRLISLSDGTNSNRVFLGLRLNTGYLYYFVVSGGSTQSDFITTNTSVNQFSKIAVKYKANDFALWIDGVEVYADSSGNAPIGLDRLQFTDADGSTRFFFGKCKSVMVFKEALSDLELACLTGYNNHELYMNYYNRLSYLGLVEEYNVESDINNYIL